MIPDITPRVVSIKNPWQIFTLYSEAGGAVLESRRETNAHFSIISNDSRNRATSCFNRRPSAAEPPRQCRDETKYWRRQVTAGPATFFLTFQLIGRGREAINGGGITFPIAERDRGRGELN